MEHYVTLFDSAFLPQGLALHASLARHAGSHKLWVLCMDSRVHNVLGTMALPNVRLLDLSALENDRLLAVKGARTRAEYCWTLTPFTPRFVFEADPSVERVTYIDADVWLMKSPSPIFLEFEASGKQVLITDHGYAPDRDATATRGRYCVQFMTFVKRGCEPVRKRWEDLCIDCCQERIEEGKFGDQKYLDDWPERFPEYVHVLTHKEWTLAPWNATRFPYGDGLFWHFQGLRLMGRRGGSVSRVDFGSYALPQVTQSNVYKPYFRDIIAAICRMRQYGIEATPQEFTSLWYLIIAPLRGLRRERWRFRGNVSAVVDQHSGEA